MIKSAEIPSDFTRAATEALAAHDIILDPTSLVHTSTPSYAEDAPIEILIGKSTDTTSEFGLLRYGSYETYEGKINPHKLARRSLYGVIPSVTGTIAAPTAGDIYTHGLVKKSKDINFTVVPSVAVINQGFATLGRVPGKNVPRLKEVKGAGNFTNGQWVKGAADNTILAADLYTSWSNAVHDRLPNDHVNSWLSTPPEINSRMVTRAQEITDTWGDEMLTHEYDRDSPTEFDDFAIGMEQIADYSEPLFYAMTRKDSHGTISIKDLREKAGLLTILERRRLDENGQRITERNYRTFQKLGVLSPGEKLTRRHRREFHEIGQLYVRNILSLCMQSGEFDNPVSKQREKFIGDLTKTFA